MNLATRTITVSGGEYARGTTLVSVRLEDTERVNSVELVDTATQRPLPCQWEAAEGGGLLTWIEESLDQGSTRSYRATLSDRAPESHGEESVQLETETDGRLDVRVQGKSFTSYHYGSQWQRPYFHPVIGPYGEPVTRGFPMVNDTPDETRDHPHHRGIYTAYGEVNGVDNWGEGEDQGRTVHLEFTVLESGPVYGRAVALSDWVTPDGGKVILRERREMRFYSVAPSRLMDVDLTLTAADRDVVFGDTKEGGIIALRIATSMDVERGGRMENSNGGVNEGEIWGKRAAWCDYSGPVSGKTVGVAIFDHPESFRHPAYWHARDYGLLTANPFGVSTFKGGGPSGEHTLAAGERLDFRYRIYIHKGDATEGRVAEAYTGYAVPPTVAVQ